MAAAPAAAAVKLHPIGARAAPLSAVQWPLTSPRQIKCVRHDDRRPSETHKIVETLALRRIWGCSSGCARRSTIFTYKYQRQAPACSLTGKWITGWSLLIVTIDVAPSLNQRPRLRPYMSL